MGYQQLKDMLNENREIAQKEREAPITQCPQCAFVPLRTNKDGKKLCPICGWRER